MQNQTQNIKYIKHCGAEWKKKTKKQKFILTLKALESDVLSLSFIFWLSKFTTLALRSRMASWSCCTCPLISFLFFLTLRTDCSKASKRFSPRLSLIPWVWGRKGRGRGGVGWGVQAAGWRVAVPLGLYFSVSNTWFWQKWRDFSVYVTRCDYLGPSHWQN